MKAPRRAELKATTKVPAMEGWTGYLRATQMVETTVRNSVHPMEYYLGTNLAVKQVNKILCELK